MQLFFISLLREKKKIYTLITSNECENSTNVALLAQTFNCRNRKKNTLLTGRGLTNKDYKEVSSNSFLLNWEPAEQALRRHIWLTTCTHLKIPLFICQERSLQRDPRSIMQSHPLTDHRGLLRPKVQSQ